MKKIIIICMVLCLVLTACGKNYTEETNDIEYIKVDKDFDPDSVTPETTNKEITATPVPTEKPIQYFKTVLKVQDTFGNTLSRDEFVLPMSISYTIPSTIQMNPSYIQFYLNEVNDNKLVQNIYNLPEGTTWEFNPIDGAGNALNAWSLVDTSTISYKDYKGKIAESWEYVGLPYSGTITENSEIIITVKPTLVDAEEYKKNHPEIIENESDTIEVTSENNNNEEEVVENTIEDVTTENTTE